MCGFEPVPAVRSGPEFVDGDLEELDEATLSKMRGDVEHFDRSPELYREELAAKHVPRVGQLAHVKRFAAGQESQTELRASIALWAGHQRAAGKVDSESYRRFYFLFGVDVMTAQTLGKKEAELLNTKIRSKIV